MENIVFAITTATMILLMISIAFSNLLIVGLLWAGVLVVPLLIFVLIPINRAIIKKFCTHQLKVFTPDGQTRCDKCEKKLL